MSVSRACALVLLAALASPPAGAADKNGKAADLALTDINGKRVRLRDLRGHVVVLNFWATWCGPCKEEMPLMVEAAKEYEGRVTFVGASLDDSKSRRQVPEFLSRYAISYPVWLGATGDDLARLDLGEAVPDTVFIDGEGTIVSRVLGEIRKEELKERIEWLLGSRSGPAPEAKVVHLDGK